MPKYWKRNIFQFWSTRIHAVHSFLRDPSPSLEKYVGETFGNFMSGGYQTRPWQMTQGWLHIQIRCFCFQFWSLLTVNRQFWYPNHLATWKQVCLWGSLRPSFQEPTLSLYSWNGLNMIELSNCQRWVHKYGRSRHHAKNKSQCQSIWGCCGLFPFLASMLLNTHLSLHGNELSNL